MALFRPCILLLPIAVLFTASVSAAPLPATGVLVFSDLCRGASGFRGSRLAVTRAPAGGSYQWGDTRAETAPLERLTIEADGRIAFRYMPDADNPEVFVEVSGALGDAAFDGVADGKPLRLPRAADGGTAIPACR